MPVPGSIADLNITPSLNSPSGTENVGTIMNQYIQAAFAFIAQLNANLNPTGTLTAPAGTRLVMQQATAPAGWTVDSTSAFTDAAMRFNQSVGAGGTTAFSAFSAGTGLATGGTAISVANMPAHNHPMNDPGHNHSTNDGGHSHGASDSGHAHDDGLGGGGFMIGNAPGGSTGGFALQGPGSGSYANTRSIGVIGTGYASVSIGVSNSNISNNGSFTGVSTQNNGGGTAHTHPAPAYGLKYADCIVAIKS